MALKITRQKGMPWEHCHLRLSLSASTDETRYHLMGVHFDEQLKMVVSTDGHRLYATRQLWDEKRAGQTCKISTFAAEFEFIPIEGKYPNVKQLIPTGPWPLTATFEVPQWLEAFKQKPSAKVFLALDFKRSTLSIVQSLPEDNKHCTYLNGAYLAPFAGSSITVRVKESAGPMVITDAKVPDTDVVNAEWLAVVMPMRANELATMKTTIPMMEGETMKEENKPQQQPAAQVVSLDKHRKEVQVKKAKLTCVNEECKHEVASPDDWVIGMDAPASKGDPGTQDSGMYVCPACSTVQDGCILDGMVTMDTKTGDIQAFIPGSIVDLLMEHEASGEGDRMNIGQAIMNAVREPVLKRYGEEGVEFCYPVDKDIIMEVYGG